MGRITVAASKDHFERDGRPFFYLADTAWMAFLNCPSLDDWEEYLRVRREQGFTVLQMQSIPSAHDTSESADGLFPFASSAGGGLDFGGLTPAYRKRVAQMMDRACVHGFVPAIALLWCNWVPGTWAAKRSLRTVMPFDAARACVRETVKLFAPWGPMYLASGDTCFDSPEEPRYYGMALEEIKAADPAALTTMHLAPQGNLPEEFLRSKLLDFYMYQSGHHAEHPERPYALAEKFLAAPVKRPIVNGEPPYEGHGHGFAYGRFSAFEVRRAIWQSLLSGAKAGVTYGAHGIWMWHRRGMRFLNAEFSSMPFEWRTALGFAGAWDAGFARTIFESWGLVTAAPAQVLRGAPPGIRASATPGMSTLAFYVPFSRALELTLDLSGYDVRVVDLSERRWVAPELDCTPTGSTVAMPCFNGDFLLLARRR